nr:hypothetical protein GCM10020063_001710 [Dactylosporangium thailandense]
MTDQPETRPTLEGLDLGPEESSEEISRREVATSLLGLLCGWAGNQLDEAEASEHPDPERLAALRAQNDEYWNRKRQLPLMDGAAIQQVLEEYGPVARRLLGKE